VYIFMYVYIYVCIYLCMYLCVYIYIYVHVHWQKTSKRNKEKKNLDRVNTYSIIYTYLYIYTTVYTYIILYIYIILHIYIYYIYIYYITYIYIILHIYIYLCVFIYMRNKTTLFATPKRTYGFKYIHEDQNCNFSDAKQRLSCFRVWQFIYWKSTRLLHFALFVPRLFNVTFSHQLRLCARRWFPEVFSRCIAHSYITTPSRPVTRKTRKKWWNEHWQPGFQQHAYLCELSYNVHISCPSHPVQE
jgi:hypothetical protein